MGVLHFFFPFMQTSVKAVTSFSVRQQSALIPRHRVPESTSRISKEIKKKKEKIMLHTTAWAAWRHSVTVCVCPAYLIHSDRMRRPSITRTLAEELTAVLSFAWETKWPQDSKKTVHLPSLNLQDWNLGKTCFFCLFAYHIFFFFFKKDKVHANFESIT